MTPHDEIKQLIELGEKAHPSDNIRPLLMVSDADNDFIHAAYAARSAIRTLLQSNKELEEENKALKHDLSRQVDATNGYLEELTRLQTILDGVDREKLDDSGPMFVLKAKLEDSNQKTVANWLGISEQYLSDILRGRRAFSDKIANRLGFKRVWIELDRAALKGRGG